MIYDVVYLCERCMLIMRTNGQIVAAQKHNKPARRRKRAIDRSLSVTMATRIADAHRLREDVRRDNDIGVWVPDIYELDRLYSGCIRCNQNGRASRRRTNASYA